MKEKKDEVRTIANDGHGEGDYCSDRQNTNEDNEDKGGDTFNKVV